MHNDTAFSSVRTKTRGRAHFAAPDASQVDWQDRLVMGACVAALGVFLVMVWVGVVA